MPDRFSDFYEEDKGKFSDLYEQQPSWLKKEAKTALEFAKFPYTLTKETTYPALKGLVTYPFRPKEAEAEMRRAGETGKEMATGLGKGVLDWMVASGLTGGIGTPVIPTTEQTLARLKIGERVKEGGVLAESVYPLTLMGGVRGLIGKATPKTFKAPEMAKVLEKPTEVAKEIPKAELPEVLKKPEAFGERAMREAREVKEIIEKGKRVKAGTIPEGITLSEVELKTLANEMLNDAKNISKPVVTKGRGKQGVRVVYDPTTTPEWYPRQSLSKTDVLTGLRQIVKDGYKSKDWRAENLFLTIEEWSKRKDYMAKATEIVGADLVAGDRVKINGEWYTAKPHEATGTVELIDSQNIKLDIFDRLPVEEFQKAEPLLKEQIVQKPPAKQIGLPTIDRQIAESEMAKPIKRVTGTKAIKEEILGRPEAEVLPGQMKLGEKPTELHAGIRPEDLAKAVEPLPDVESYKIPEVQEGKIVIQRTPRDMAEWTRKYATLERAAEFSPETKEAFRLATKAENDYSYNAIEETKAIDDLAKTMPEDIFEPRTIFQKIAGKRVAVKEDFGKEVISSVEGLKDITEVPEPVKNVAAYGKEFFGKYKTKIKTELKARGVPEAELENWGVKDYFHRMMTGDVIIADKPRMFKGGEWQYGKILDFADNIWDAEAKVRTLSKNTPGKSYYIYPRYAQFPMDMVRISRKRYHILAKAIADEGGWEIRDGYQVLRGKVGQRPGKKFGRMVQRRVSEKSTLDDIFVHDPFTVMKSYAWATERWLKMSEMRRQLTPLHENLISQGRPIAARWIEDLRTWTESPYSQMEKSFQNTLNHIPVIGDKVKPFVARRAIRLALMAENYLKLTNPGYWIANYTQPFITLSPLNPKLFRRLTWEMKISPNKYNNLLAEMKFKPSLTALSEGMGYRGKIGKALTGQSWIEVRNQKLASIFGYKYATEVLKKPHAEALEFGRMLNIQTQFPSMASTTIPWMRGTFRKPFIQYKAFGQKMISNVVYPYTKAIFKSDWKTAGNFWTRYLAMIGAKGIGEAAWTGGAGLMLYKLYNETRKRFGEKTAKVALIGLPAIVGIDISSRIAPNLIWGYGDIYSKVGRTALGPMAGDVIAISRAMIDDDPSGFGELSPWVRTYQKEFKPGLKGKEVEISPYTGRPTYGVTPYQKFLRTVGIVPAEHTIERLRTQAGRDIIKQQTETKTKIKQLYAKGEKEKAKQMKADWNEKHPHLKIIITPKEINKEKEKMRMTSEERFLEGLSKKRRKGLIKELENY